MFQQKIIGINIDIVTFDKALELIESYIKEPKFHLITTTNPEFILEAQSDQHFKEILNHADLSLPDGVGVLMASSYLNHAAQTKPGLLRPLKLFLTGLKVGFLEKLPERIGGADFFNQLIGLANSGSLRIGLLGGEEYSGKNVCDLVKTKLTAQHPDLKIVYCSREPSDEAFTTPIDFLFVAFGHPKQEKWLWENKDRLSKVKIGMGVGGTFDFIVGKRRRAPELVQRIKLEWLWRFFSEPSRFRRIFNAYPRFPLKVFLSSL